MVARTTYTDSGIFSTIDMAPSKETHNSPLRAMVYMRLPCRRGPDLLVDQGCVFYHT